MIIRSIVGEGKGTVVENLKIAVIVILDWLYIQGQVEVARLSSPARQNGQLMHSLCEETLLANKNIYLK